MQIAILKERTSYGQYHESRVAATPDTVKQYISLGFTVTIEQSAGVDAGFLDAHYQEAGATLVSTALEAVKHASLILALYPVALQDTLHHAPKHTLVIGLYEPYQHSETLARLAAHPLTCVSMEMVPRITRAQTMDVLSSQSNLAGYRAVLEAAQHMTKVIPMMTTAAGSVAPAKALILGAGVAGLQAIATAKRLGAVVSAFDVRIAAKEQVESLGAKFVMVAEDEATSLETKGGYAKEASTAYQAKQRALIHEVIRGQDMVITTALIPGKAAPKLITAEMVASMKAGSVIIDLAAASGGNCELTVAHQKTIHHGVTIIGYGHLASFVAKDASQLYAKNLLAMVKHLYKTGEGNITLTLDTDAAALEDEITKACCLTYKGSVIHPQFRNLELTMQGEELLSAAVSTEQKPKKPATRKATRATTKKTPHTTTSDT